MILVLISGDIVETPVSAYGQIVVVNRKTTEALVEPGRKVAAWISRALDAIRGTYGVWSAPVCWISRRSRGHSF